MKLLYKMPLTMAGIVALYFIAVIGLQKVFVLPRFSALEQATALRNLDHVTAALDREALHLAVLDRDRSSWDDTYDFIESGSASYLSTNLAPASVRSARVDFIAIYGADRGLRFQAVYDWSRGTMQPAGLLPSRRRPLL